MAPSNTVRYPEVAKRIADTISKSTRIPDGHGKLAYLAREWETRFGEPMGREQMRTWVNGLREPRPEQRVRLAELLGVDPAWLWSGTTASFQTNASGFGAEESVACMLLQAGGWKIRKAQSREYDLDAEIRGRAYKIEVKAAQRNDDAWTLKLPRNISDVVLLAVLVDPISAQVRLIHLEGDAGEQAVIRQTDEGFVFEGASGRVIDDLTKPI